jgi:proteasome activator subunit 4
LCNILQVYDGVRRLALPVLVKALESGTDDHRMKGALWTISSNVFGRYVVSGEYTFRVANENLSYFFVQSPD